MKIDSHLLLNDNQETLLQAVIDNKKIVTIKWTSEQQLEAKEFLKNNELLPEQISTGNTKWRTRNTNDRKNIIKHLYQCTCGSNVIAHKNMKGTGKSQAQFNFVECLAYIEITIEKKSGHFLKVKGYFEHNEECKNALRIAPPALNIHPAVRQMALDLLVLNASTTQILCDNQKFVEERCQCHVISDNYRLLLKPSDISNFMREHRKSQLKINTRMLVEHSLENIFHKTSNNDEMENHDFSLIREACFHYEPKTKDNRLEIGLSTKEQRNLAWSYGHQNILLLDGTFGICNRKILFFIILILDEKLQGIPIAYFIFSPPSGKCVQGGYNYAILQKFLNKFKDILGMKNEISFTPKVNLIIMYIYYFFSYLLFKVMLLLIILLYRW